MLFTRETDYALRILRHLDIDELRSISSIVQQEYISLPIAYKVARKLEQGGLIRSVRGNSGGYRLKRDLSEITLLDVYRIMNPDTAINECLREGHECPLNGTNGSDYCRMHKELARVQDSLYRELSSKSLAAILAE